MSDLNVRKLLCKINKASVVKKPIAAKPRTPRKEKCLDNNRQICWNDYAAVFDQIDNLKYQLPSFGTDRMHTQFFSLLDTACFAGSTYNDCSADTTNTTEANTVFAEQNSPSLMVWLGYENFIRLSFDELVARYVFRVFLSAFNNDAVDDNSGFVDDNNADHHNSVVDRALKLFGPNVAKSVRLNESNVFAISGKFGDRKEAEYLKRIRAIWQRQNLSTPRLLPCMCCCAALRLVLIDTPLITSNKRNELCTEQLFAVATEQTYVLLNLSLLLYRSIDSEKFNENFDIKKAFRDLAVDRNESRCSFAKTARVQRMSFYQRAYAVHAAVYVIVLWLWGRQEMLHISCGYTTRSPPIILTMDNRLSPLFTKLDTLFLRLLLKQRILFFHFL